MISIEKVTLNIGAGSEPKNLEKAQKLLKKITGQKSVGKPTKKKIPAWGVRKKMILGAKTTLRKEKANEILKICLAANENVLKNKSFSANGNFSFGIKSYIDLPGFKYDPDIGLMGFEICVTMKKWGYGIKNRKIRPGKVPKRHFLTKDESIKFMEEKFEVKVE